MKQYHLNRLLKLADHLSSGKFGHVKFDFNNFHVPTVPGSCIPANKCGFAGCAIGECPVAFPRQWRFRGLSPQLKDRNTLLQFFRAGRRVDFGDAERSGQIFFGVDGNEFSHLFVPGGQRTLRYGGWVLGDTPTAKQVARNIRVFVKREERKRAAK